jgi:hypothetical protein
MDEMENIVTFEDDEGNTFELEIMDYFNYNGNDYVILADIADDDSCCDHDHDDEGCGCGCGCGHEETDVYVMQVVPVDEENEEFVPIPEDMEAEVLAFADKFLSGELDELTDEDEDEGEDE